MLLRCVNCNALLGFGVLIAALMKIPVFWHIRPYGLVCGCRRFGGTRCLYDRIDREFSLFCILTYPASYRLQEKLNIEQKLIYSKKGAV
jgi:hypothetical protein